MPRKKKPSVYSLALKQVQEASRNDQEQPAIQVVEQPNSQTAKQLPIKPSKPQRIKATFYLQPEDVIAIDEMQTKRFRATGKKPEKSELVSEAIQLLSKQQNDGL
jgi:hypothetical protein